MLACQNPDPTSASRAGEPSTLARETRETRAAGKELAASLERWLVPAPRGTKRARAGQVLATCQEIAMLARRHLELGIAGCNRPMLAREVSEESAIEARLTALVATLPATPDGPLVARLGGDPRGYTVKIHVPGELARHYGNTWGLDGDYGV